MDQIIISVPRLLVFLGCCIFFYFAYRKRAIDKSGLFSAIALGAILLATLPLMVWFVMMVVFFVAGSLTARFKRNRKVKIGVAERAKGRGLWNVLGNGGVGMISAVAFAFSHDSAFLVAYACSIASACADTIATELGQLSGKKPIMLSTMKPVKIGTTGAVSAFGELMAFFGALLIALIPFVYFGFYGLWDFTLLFIITASGFIGCQVDSIIGAFLEYPSMNKKGLKIINNHSTNFLSSLAAAVVGVALFILLA